MTIVINDKEAVLDFKQTMTTLSRLKNIQKFIEDMFKYFEENDLYTNMEEAKSMMIKTTGIEQNLLNCLYYGKLLADELSLIEIKYTKEFIENFRLEIKEDNLIEGAGFVLKYLGVYNEYCNSVSNTSLYRISGELYDLWDSNFTRKLSIPIYHGSRKSRRIIGYNSHDGWESMTPIYDNEGWY